MWDRIRMNEQMNWLTLCFLTLSSQRKVLQRQQSEKRNWNSIGKILREEGIGAVKRQKFLGTLTLDGPRFTVSGKYLDFK